MSSPAEAKTEELQAKETDNEPKDENKAEVHADEAKPAAKDEEIVAKPAEEATSSNCNPSVADEDELLNELASIRGDAIGDTMYSERFVLSTLLKLSDLQRDISEDSKFEKELCAVWDMTVEEDVVKFLLNHDLLELFGYTIDISVDKRLIEILVGIIGNMCMVQETAQKLVERPSVMSSLCRLLDCSDAPTLIQLFRVFTVMLADSEGNLERHHLCRNVVATPDLALIFAGILENSVNKALLRQGLEALNAILASTATTVTETVEREGQTDISFSNIFMKALFIRSSLEAFKTFMYEEEPNCADEDIVETFDSKTIGKTIQAFLNIHCILVEYGANPHTYYQPLLSELTTCFSLIWNELDKPEHIQPVTKYAEDLVDTLNDLSLALGDPVDDKCLKKMITIWFDVSEEEGGDDWGSNIFCPTMIDLLIRTVGHANFIDLGKAIKELPAAKVEKLFKLFETHRTRPEFKEGYYKMRTLIQLHTRDDRHKDDDNDEESDDEDKEHSQVAVEAAE